MPPPAVVSDGLVYDADCGFCTRSARWLSHGTSWAPVPWQGIEDLGGLSLTEDMVTTAAYWVRDGRVVAAGPSAIAAGLRTHRGWRRALGAVIDAPVVRPLAAAVYRQVSKNRHAMPGGTDACRLPPPA